VAGETLPATCLLNPVPPFKDAARLYPVAIRTQKTTHLDDPAAVGQRLRAARTRAGLTLRALSLPGCSAAYISHIESGRRTPSLQILVQLARRLRISPQYLAWGSDEPLPASASPYALDERTVSFAIGVYEQALARAGTREQRLWTLSCLAHMAALHGDLERAVTTLEQGVQLVKEEEAPEATRAA
jgi:transcriptional regulator with XRE-family HTH domain